MLASCHDAGIRGSRFADSASRRWVQLSAAVCWLLRRRFARKPTPARGARVPGRIRSRRFALEFLPVAATGREDPGCPRRTGTASRICKLPPGSIETHLRPVALESARLAARTTSSQRLTNPRRQLENWKLLVAGEEVLWLWMQERSWLSCYWFCSSVVPLGRMYILGIRAGEAQESNPCRRSQRSLRSKDEGWSRAKVSRMDVDSF